MKTFQHALLLLVVQLFSAIVFSQNVEMPELSPGKPHRFSLTVSSGLSFSNTGSDLMQGMINSGLNNRTPLEHHIVNFFIFGYDYTTGGEEYPRKQESKVFYNFQARYDLTPKSAVAINWNTSGKTTVEGYDKQGENGNFLTLVSNSRILTLEYILRTNKGWSGLSVGPALAFHNVDQEPIYTSVDLYHHKTITPGIHLGYTLSFIKKGNWVLGMNAGYNWFPKDNVGPITVDGEFTSVYEMQPVSLNTFDLGITTGFKF